MKSVLVLCLLGLVTLSIAAKIRSRRCIYVEGRCFKSCPEGTHSYTPGCNHKVPEPTCDQPQPVAEQGVTCDYTSCYCNEPNVRDKKTDKCVPMDQCTKDTQPEENQNQQEGSEVKEE